MPIAHINAISTAVPAHEVHGAFVRYARRQLGESRRGAVFDRMVARGGIEQRFSILKPSEDGADAVDADGFYEPGNFPTTGARMLRYEQEAPALAVRAVKELGRTESLSGVTHLIVTSCTGFSAPGIDLDIIEQCGLSGSVERTLVGFMGCYAAVNALKLAHHIVRSEATARVLVVNLELCTLHLQNTTDIEKLLSFYLFGDGCAAAFVTSEPRGMAIDSFRAILAPNSREHITWAVRDSGFDMVLSGAVPAAIEAALAGMSSDLAEDGLIDNIQLWAVHPGGRTVLDAVERALDLHSQALGTSRSILRDYGNMSSATVMFVLARMMGMARRGDRGCAMAFGPGLVAETMQFHAAG